MARLEALRRRPETRLMSAEDEVELRASGMTMRLLATRVT
jgi:hypothetical protein